MARNPHPEVTERRILDNARILAHFRIPALT